MAEGLLRGGGQTVLYMSTELVLSLWFARLRELKFTGVKGH
jgi:hypothetical protein